MRYSVFMTIVTFIFAMKDVEGKSFDQMAKHVCEPVITIRPPGSKCEVIPRRLFQTWKTHELPKNFAAWSETWKMYNPEWEFVLWDDEENREFIAAHYPWFLLRYDSYSKEIYRADAVRYFYLYTYGGIYADLDFECYKSLEPLLEENSVILGSMVSGDPDHSIPNAFMASPPKAEFWLIVIHHLLNAPEELRPEYTTGPVILRKAVLAYQNKKQRQMILDQMKHYFQDGEPIEVQVRPPCELYPYDWITKVYQKFPCSYAITWWSHTWE